MNKIMISALVVFVSVIGCATSNASDEMYELATTLSKVTRAVDTAHRYGTISASLSDAEFIKQAVANQSLLNALEPFDLILHREGSEVLLLVCEDERALLADVGCTSRMDAHYWRQAGPKSCSVDKSLLSACSATN